MSEFELAIQAEPYEQDATNFDVEVVPVEGDEFLLVKEAVKRSHSY
jgi:hypothetical protein